MSKTVIINHNGQQQQLQLPQGRTQHLRFNPQAHYRFLDEQQQPIEAIKIEQKGDSLWFYLPEQAEPILILDDASQFVPMFHLDNPLYLPPVAASGTAESALLATAVSTPTSGNAWKVGLGALALLGAGAAIAGSSSSNDDEAVKSSQTSNPIPNSTTTPQIHFNSITDDNIINLAESQTAVQISGSVQNFHAGDKLSVAIGQASPILVDIQTDGSFQFMVDGRTLAAHAEIHASLTTQDSAGNHSTASAQANYAVDITPPNPEITFNPITSDNKIDLAESQGSINVSGNITGAKDGDEVIVSCGCPTCSGIKWIDIKTTLTDGKFSVNFEGADMVANDGKNIIKATITTSDNAKNTATATAEKSYEVDITSNPIADQQAQIYLDDVKLDLAKEIGSVRLSGKLDFANSDSMYKWGHNKDFVRSISLKIGDKEFMVGIDQDDYSFYVDLTHEQYQSLKGKNISHELFAHNGVYANWLPIFDYKLDVKERWVGVSDHYSDYAKDELSKIKVNFDNPNIQNAKILEFDIDAKTEISGKVVNAKTDDEITINFGSKEYKTTVKNDLTFSIQVENTELNNLKNIQATLSTKNNKGETISVSDVGYVLQNMQISDNFVNPHESIPHEKRVIQHTNPNYNFPYFIHSLSPFGEHYIGFLNKLPFAGVGEPVTIKYYFVTQEDYDSGKYQPTHLDKSTWSAYSEAHKEVARDVYKQISDATNIRFVETLNEADKDTFLMRGNHLDGWAGTAGFGGGIAVNVYDAQDGYYKAVLIHEILHTLAAGHLEFILEQFDYSKYDLFGKISNVVGYGGGGKDGILRAYDLAYLHYRFGVNPNHHSGNDVYHFQTFTDKTSEAGIYIWDGGGVDTFDASQEKEGVTVNLTPGSWIYRGEKSDSFIIKDKVKINDSGEMNKFFPEFSDSKFIGVSFPYSQIIYQEGQAFIGYGTQIENLIGSAYNDVLTGNKAENNIFGGDGNDKIDGGEGNDYLDGGKGADIILGGLGDDIFVVDNGNDQIIENTAEGNDTVYAFLDYSLPNNVENIHLFGTANQAAGNELNNIITGNDHNNILLGGAGNDTLNGGRGNDTLTGDSGTDTFVFNSLLDGSIDTITDFEIGIDKIQLASNIFTHLTNNNLSEYLQYNQNTGALFYDPDGKGGMDSIHFATLQNRPDLPIDINHFILG